MGKGKRRAFSKQYEAEVVELIRKSGAVFFLVKIVLNGGPPVRTATRSGSVQPLIAWRGRRLQSRIAATQAVMKLASEPERIARRPRLATSARRPGARPPRPPSRIASEPKFAKPQSA